MSTYNNQKVEKEKNDSSINNTNNELSLKNDMKSEKVKEKKQICIKALIIGISIILAGALIVVIIIIFRKKKDKKKRYFIEDDGRFIEENKTGYFETDGTIIDYDNAEKLIGSEITKENHNLLDKISININESLSICNNINFTAINLTFNDNPKKIEFLISLNSNENSLQFAKINLYISKYNNLSEQADTLTKSVSEFLMFLSGPLNEFKKKNDNITKQFEKTIQNFAIPLSLNSKHLKNIILDEFKKGIDNLNKFYNIFFNKTKEVSGNFYSSIKLIYDSVNFLNIKVNDIILLVNKIIETNETKPYEKLIEIKNISISFNKDIDNLISKCNKKKVEISKLIEEIENFDSFKKEEINIITNMNNLILEMGKNNNNKISKLETFIESNANSTIVFIKYIDLILKKIPEICNEYEIHNVEI
jgi:hypothetical protein